MIALPSTYPARQHSRSPTTADTRMIHLASRNLIRLTQWRVSVAGTAAYRGRSDLPELVVHAVALAERLNFEFSCRPEQGRLPQLLAAGRGAGSIGETGSGCGVGIAWLLSGAGDATPIVSVERDAERANHTAQLFADHPNVTVLVGDWPVILARGPFDLLVLDGGGTGKTPHDVAVDPKVALKPFGTVVIDDFTPLSGWPPLHEGQPDAARLHWLQHPELLATEIVVCAEMSTILATRRS